MKKAILVNVHCDDHHIMAHHQKMVRKLLSALDKANEQWRVHLTEKVRDALRYTIQRPNESKGNLERSITSNLLMRRDSLVIGVGHIQTLNDKAPYWRLIDEGGFVSPRARIVPGYFVDEGGSPVPFDRSKTPMSLNERSTDVFVYTPGGTRTDFDIFSSLDFGALGVTRSLMYVGRPIQAHNYFNRGHEMALARFRAIYDNVFREADLT